MERNCGSCSLGRKHGTLIYCTYYGMPISPSHKNCKVHSPKIKEDKNDGR